MATLSQSTIQRVLEEALAGGADFAELFYEDTFESQITLKNSQPTEGMVGQLNGVGLRLILGTEDVYTHTNDVSEEGLIKCAQAAAQAIRRQSQTQLQPLVVSSYDQIFSIKEPPWEITKDFKIGQLFRFDRAARDRSGSVSQVVAALSETLKTIQIANSEGLLIEEQRPYYSARVQVVVEDGGVIETGSDRCGGTASAREIEGIDLEGMAHIATDLAVQNLTAAPAPAGEMPVVLASGFGGVIFHEACGHGLETTSVAKKASVFCDKLETSIAASCVTAIDDGRIAGENGTLAIDDEGMPTQKTVLIENGVLKSYLVDRMGAIKTGFQRTGSGRRQDYRFAPASRMRNTFIAAGDDSLESMIADIDDGLYAKRMGGGSVSPGDGAYNFVVQEGFVIKNGKISHPVKGASLIGKGYETLQRIQKVGRDFALAPGTCGSVSGWVPVTVGQPSLLVSKMIVGGRASA